MKRLTRLKQHLVYYRYLVRQWLEDSWKTTKQTCKCLWQRLYLKLLGCLHTFPVWVQDFGHGSCNQTYHGECRTCGMRLTKDYRYSDEEGPFLKDIPKVWKNNRSLESIILKCLTMFEHV